MPLYAATMFAAGLGIPVLAALNAALGRHLEAPMVAGVVLFSVALLTAVLVAATTAPQGLAKITTAPVHLFLAGVLIAFYVLSITYIAPRFGVGNAVFFVLIGQMVSATIIDHFGLFGAVSTPLSLTRAAGLVFMAIGLFLTQRSSLQFQ